MAVTARTFGQRPSALLAVKDEVLALAVDLAAAVRLVRLDQRAGYAPEDVDERLERGFAF